MSSPGRKRRKLIGGGHTMDPQSEQQSFSPNLWNSPSPSIPDTPSRMNESSVIRTRTRKRTRSSIRRRSRSYSHRSHRISSKKERKRKSNGYKSRNKRRSSSRRRVYEESSESGYTSTDYTSSASDGDYMQCLSDLSGSPSSQHEDHMTDSTIIGTPETAKTSKKTKKTTKINTKKKEAKPPRKDKRVYLKMVYKAEGVVAATSFGIRVTRKNIKEPKRYSIKDALEIHEENWHYFGKYWNPKQLTYEHIKSIQTPRNKEKFENDPNRIKLFLAEVRKQIKIFTETQVDGNNSNDTSNPNEPNEATPNTSNQNEMNAETPNPSIVPTPIPTSIPTPIPTPIPTIPSTSNNFVPITNLSNTNLSNTNISNTDYTATPSIDMPPSMDNHSNNTLNDLCDNNNNNNTLNKSYDNTYDAPSLKDFSFPSSIHNVPFDDNTYPDLFNDESSIFSHGIATFNHGPSIFHDDSSAFTHGPSTFSHDSSIFNEHASAFTHGASISDHIDDIFDNSPSIIEPAICDDNNISHFQSNDAVPMQTNDNNNNLPRVHHAYQAMLQLKQREIEDERKRKKHADYMKDSRKKNKMEKAGVAYRGASKKKVGHKAQQQRQQRMQHSIEYNMGGMDSPSFRIFMNDYLFRMDEGKEYEKMLDTKYNQAFTLQTNDKIIRSERDKKSWKSKRRLAIFHVVDMKKRHHQHIRNLGYDYKMEKKDEFNVPTLTQRATVADTDIYVQQPFASEYMMKQSKKWIMDIMMEKYGIKYEENNNGFVYTEKYASSNVDPLSMTKFMVSCFLNCQGFAGLCDFYRTILRALRWKMDLLYDAKSMKKCKDRSLTMIAGRIKEIFQHIPGSPFILIPYTILSVKDTKSNPKVDFIKGEIEGKMMKIPIYKTDRVFDPLLDDKSIYDEDNDDIDHFVEVTIEVVTKNGDWLANPNATGGANSKFPLYRTPVISKWEWFQTPKLQNLLWQPFKSDILKGQISSLNLYYLFINHDNFLLFLGITFYHQLWKLKNEWDDITGPIMINATGELMLQIIYESGWFEQYAFIVKDMNDEEKKEYDATKRVKDCKNWMYARGIPPYNLDNFEPSQLDEFVLEGLHHRFCVLRNTEQRLINKSAINYNLKCEIILGPFSKIVNLNKCFYEPIKSKLDNKDKKSDRIRVQTPGNVQLVSIKELHQCHKNILINSAEISDERERKQLILYITSSYCETIILIKGFCVLRRIHHPTVEPLKIARDLTHDFYDYMLRQYPDYGTSSTLKHIFEAFDVCIGKVYNSYSKGKDFGIAINNTSAMEHLLKIIQNIIVNHNNNHDQYLSNIMNYHFCQLPLAIIYECISLKQTDDLVNSAAIKLWDDADIKNYNIDTLPLEESRKMAKYILNHKVGDVIPPYIANLKVTKEKKKKIKKAAARVTFEMNDKLDVEPTYALKIVTDQSGKTKIRRTKKTKPKTKTSQKVTTTSSKKGYDELIDDMLD